MSQKGQASLFHKEQEVIVSQSMLGRICSLSSPGNTTFCSTLLSSLRPPLVPPSSRSLKGCGSL